MVKPLIEAVKTYPAAFNWVARFGAAVVIGLYLVWFVCNQYAKLIDFTVEAQKERAVTDVKQTEALTKVGTIADSMNVEVNSQRAIHKSQLDSIDYFHRKIEDHDRQLDAMQKGIVSNGEYARETASLLKQNGEFQREMRDELRNIRIAVSPQRSLAPPPARVPAKGG